LPTVLHSEEPTSRSRIGRMSAAQLGLVVLFASMSVLFGASVIGYLFTRAANPVWRTPEMPPLPLGLLTSTALLAGLSIFMHRAVGAVRDNRPEGLLRELKFGLFCALAFLVAQSTNWQAMIPALHGSDPYARYAFTFYWLTALHAAHVVGGFVPLGIVIARARKRQYSSSRFEGVRLCKQYWDYLGIVWIVLLATLYFGT
jgi:cytochrome c oxidase subunit 3